MSVRIVDGVSHTDHMISREVLDKLITKYDDRTGFFIDTVDLPPDMPALSCEIHGPSVGESPVTDDETYTTHRGTRPWLSRMCRRPSAPTRQITIIAGPEEGYEGIILYTAFPGPCAPKEPGDPTLGTPEAKAESEAFWAQHALSEPFVLDDAVVDVILTSPEIQALASIEQSAPHTLNALEHTKKVLEGTCRYGGFAIFWHLVAVLHDWGKAFTYVDKEGRKTFPMHAVSGATASPSLLRRLVPAMPEALIEQVCAAITEHMWPLAGIRPNQNVGDKACIKWVRRVTEAGLVWQDLFAFAEADLYGRGASTEYLDGELKRLGEFRHRITALVAAEAAQVAKPKLVVVTGDDVAQATGLQGKAIGDKLKALTAYVEAHPEINTREAQLAALVTL